MAVGFLDGKEGYYFARLHAMDEYLCVIKTIELKSGSQANGSLTTDHGINGKPPQENRPQQMPDSLKI
jgi:hypothetical protein